MYPFYIDHSSIFTVTLFEPICSLLKVAFARVKKGFLRKVGYDCATVRLPNRMIQNLQHAVCKSHSELFFSDPATHFHEVYVLLAAKPRGHKEMSSILADQ